MREGCAPYRYQLGEEAHRATVFLDGRVGEIFVSNSKPSSTSDTYARDAAVAASLAFQHGFYIATLKHAVLRDQNGEPSSPLGKALDMISAPNKEIAE